jgi:hypothetical protein
MEQYMARRQKNRAFFGIAIAVVGILMLLRALGLFYFDMHEMWPFVLITIGVLLGIKNNFRNHAWWILILIGTAHLIPQFTINGRASRHFVWPIAVIIGGIMIAFRSRKSDNRCAPLLNASVNGESYLDIDVTFGGKKEMVTSKNLKGGTINVTFAGCELNLSQADFTEQTVTLDFKVFCGGVEMVVPPHWDIRNEIRPSFGAVEDERTMQAPSANENRKTLILRGSCSFGGIEIKSF